MPLTKRSRPTITETPTERAERLQREYDELPALEAAALDAGDEDTLGRLDARRRVIRHELDVALADAREAALEAARAPLTSRLAELNADVATTAARLDELKFALEAYRLLTGETETHLAATRRQVLHTLDRLADLDAEALRTETTVLRRTLEARHAA